MSRYWCTCEYSGAMLCEYCRREADGPFFNSPYLMDLAGRKRYFDPPAFTFPNKPANPTGRMGWTEPCYPTKIVAAKKEANPSPLPDTDAERKKLPLGTGVLDYFPKAMLAVAEASYAATQQHHPGGPMHWDRSKSTDHVNCMLRHFLDRGTKDSDGVRHSAKMVWRAMAILEEEIEKETGKPISRGSK